MGSAENRDTAAELVCRRVLYSGRVQGVGFRYTAQQLADGFPVAGFVRNLSTGEVELVAEGSAQATDAFLAALAERMRWYIERSTVRTESPQGLRSFTIRY